MDKLSFNACSGLTQWVLTRMCFLSLFIHEIKADEISICYQMCSQCSSSLPTYLSSSVTGLEGVKVCLE